MKDKFLSKAYGGVTVARRKLYGLGLPRQWKVITSTLLLLFTFSIGNVWADPQSVTLELRWEVKVMFILQVPWLIIRYYQTDVFITHPRKTQ